MFTALDAELRRKEAEVQLLKAQLASLKLNAISLQLERETAEVIAIQAALKEELGIADEPASPAARVPTVRLLPASRDPSSLQPARNPSPIESDEPHWQKQQEWREKKKSVHKKGRGLNRPPAMFFDGDVPSLIAKSFSVA